MIRRDYIDELERHRLCCVLADYAEKLISVRQLIDLCPDDYGDEITDDHRNYYWDQCYDEVDGLDDFSLLRKYEALIHPNRETNQRFDNPFTWGKDRKLCN